MVTTNEEGTTTLAASSLADEKGKSFESKLDEIQTSDMVVLFNTDLVDNHQVAGFFVKRTPKRHKVVVVDSRRTSRYGRKDSQTRQGQRCGHCPRLDSCHLETGGGENKTEEPNEKLLAAKIEKAGVPADELNEVVKLVADC